ncbi:hypothetical protein [Arsenicibacter rosenii]|uniref:Phage portal protein n=1 Tax=Arsenicibacter rosenii TaxID=1750698 RepID=A0A1S2VM27_9BACT|nr:hypothetical protein [Arsenicibacter rosenii]OIN59812.1 hypothetical protein BLX24_08110 [Arsenicibacter rosenii]
MIEYFEGDQYDVAVIAATGKSPGVSFALAKETLPGAAPSAVALPDALMGSAVGDVMPWGDGNDFPQQLAVLYNNDPIIPKTLDKVASMMIGRGVLAVLADVDESGEEADVPMPKDHPVAAEIRTFLQKLDFRRYLRESAGDIAWFFNAWPELILSKDRQKIVQIHELNAEECRWCRMDENGNLPHVYLSSAWPNVTISEERYTKKLTALDPYRWDRVDWVRESDFYKFVYPISYPTPGRRYYSLAHHYALIQSGWYHVHLDVPAYKKYLLKNQISVKYHIKVDQAYWPIRFGGAEVWNKLKAEEKRAKIQGWLKTLTDTLTSAENAGKAIMTEIAFEPAAQNKVRDYVQITTIDDKTKDGKFLDDNLEAAANVFYALGVDPAIVGFAGGDKMGAKSGGSDKREAYLIALQMLAPFREMLLEPLEFIAEYNGWKAAFPNLTFRFRDTILTTLDTGAGTKKVVS